MAEAERALPDPRLVDLFNPAPTQAARLALAQGRVEDAARWVRERRLRPDDEPSFPREREYLILARVLVAEGEPERALPLLARLAADAAAQGRNGGLIEVRVVQALARAAARDMPGGLAALGEAVALAAPEGHARVFADEGAPLAALLDRLRTTPPGRAEAARSGLPEPLTARELEVLELLAAGRSNQGIAEDLVITLHTVKRHVTHILAKPAAANRTQAVTRARQLGLLP